MDQVEKIIPKQKIGASTGATNRKESETRHEALLLFNDAKKRLLDINNWDRLCGKASAVFQITDADGMPLKVDQPKVGNLIRISLPAPPNTDGKGFDWVRIEAFINEKDMIKDEDIFGFRVRPVPHPEKDENGSSHFYSHTATSTFLVIRNTNKVVALERGRNEKPNTAPARFINKLRNVAIALGAMLGLSTPQWKALVHGILNGPAET